MVHPHSTGLFEKVLLQFMSEEDPMLAMLKWLLSPCKKNLRPGGNKSNFHVSSAI